MMRNPATIPRLVREGMLAACLIAAAILTVPANVRAQAGDPSERRGYVHFPVKGDLETRLRHLLQHAQGRAKFDDFLKQLVDGRQLRRDPLELFNELAKDPARVEQLKDWYTKNPLVKSEVDSLLARARANKLLDSALDRQIQNLMKDGEKDLNGQGPGGIAPSGTDTQAPMDRSTSPQTPVTPPDESEPEPMEDGDPLGDWLRDWMEHAEDTRLGDFLRDSPAFQRGLLDLQHSFLQRSLDGGRFEQSAVYRMASRVRFSEAWNSAVLKHFAAKLGQLPAPSLPMPHLGGRGLSWAAPSAPSLGTGNVTELGRASLWLLLIGGVALLVRQVLMRHRAGAATSEGAWKLGPWPIAPAQVASRGDVIQAFEHLSFLLLGPTVRSYNHRAIAVALAGTDAERRQAADELASLYEWARYAPANESMPAEAVAAARRDLCMLAGVTDG